MKKDCGNCLHRKFNPETGLSCGITGQKPVSFDACLNYEPDKAALEIQEHNATEIPGEPDESPTVNIEAEVLPLNSQRLVLSIGLALATGLALSCLWALFTSMTDMQLGIMPIVVGFLVGLVIRLASKNNSIGMGIVASVIALASCFLGDFLVNIHYIALSEEMEYFETLGAIDWRYFFEIATLEFDGMSAFFYILAIIEAFSLVHGKKNEE